MKISYKWLQEYFDEKLPPAEELADLLNVRAFEVEDIESKGDDSIFEIKVTPDRAPDCLSHIGIAREVGVHTGLTMRQFDFLDMIASDFETKFEVIAQENSCTRYMLREVRNVTVTESPTELKNKLESIGQRSINTIVDITNLVMYEIGQPMHAFDVDKLSGTQIIIGEPQKSSITTLDNKEITLTQEDLTIQDKLDNLAIAGVKGGKKAEVTPLTKNILLESANFFPVKVRKTSKRTGIMTDSSKRFENGLTPKLAEYAINRASTYINMYASTQDTQFSNVVDVYPRPQPRSYQVGLKIENVSKKLGVEMSESDILNVLSRLGMKTQKCESLSCINQYIGSILEVPYKFGASTLFDAPYAFDCSSLMSYLFLQIGITIPRTSIDQFVFSKKVTKDQLIFGDLIFNNSGEGKIHYVTQEFLPGSRVDLGIDHVGMYMGDGKVLHASRYQEKGTVIEDLESSTQFQNITGYGRICEDADFPRYIVQIPYERLDLKTEIDLIEEIGRTYGYERIAPVAPVLTNQAQTMSTYDRIATLKSHLIDIGFDEVVTYTFKKKGDIAVTKPLASDKAYLRTNLTQGLTEALELNFKNKELFAQDKICIFEIGHVFADDTEKTVLAIAVRSAHKKQKSKHMLEEALAYLSTKTGVVFDATVSDNQEVIEIDLNTILEVITTPHNSLYALPVTSYIPFSTYPFMTRDIAVWASDPKTPADIEDIITKLGTELLVRYDMFDTYATEGKTSYAYRLVFQSANRTLMDEEVNPIMESIYNALTSDQNFEIR